MLTANKNLIRVILADDCRKHLLLLSKLLMEFSTEEHFSAIEIKNNLPRKKQNVLRSWKVVDRKAIINEKISTINHLVRSKTHSYIYFITWNH